MALMLFHTRSLYSGHVCKLCATGRCLQQCSCKASKSPQLLKSAWNFYTSHQQTFSTRPSLFRQLMGDKRGALWNLWRVPDIHRSQNGYMLQWQQYKSDYLKWSGTQTRWNSHFLPGLNHDLRRFLEEVGTDPKEARYWLKQFQRLSSIPSKPFAVVLVDQKIFQKPDMLEALSSNLAFLHRNDMKILVVHGAEIPPDGQLSDQELQAIRRQVTTETMKMVNCLEANGAQAHPLFSGSNVFRAEADNGSSKGVIIDVNTEPLTWCIESGHIPVVSSIGETASSQLVCVDASQATYEIAKAVQPIKVLLLNDKGGLLDGSNKVIKHVHVPADVEAISSQDWCNAHYQEKLRSISALLSDLPPLSSVVITSANTILPELFTHHGSGTLFKNTERIYKVKSLADVDQERLTSLVTRSFNKMLRSNYLESIAGKIHTIYISEAYNAVAIITNEEGVDGIPYLDKFAVSTQIQGEGTSDVLWDELRSDYPSLFWRSKNVNKINAWYFKRCEGSWSNHMWTVFWYGVSNPKMSYGIVDWAVNHKSSFLEADEEEDFTAVSEVGEPW